MVEVRWAEQGEKKRGEGRGGLGRGRRGRRRGVSLAQQRHHQAKLMKQREVGGTLPLLQRHLRVCVFLESLYESARTITESAVSRSRAPPSRRQLNTTATPVHCHKQQLRLAPGHYSTLSAAHGDGGGVMMKAEDGQTDRERERGEDPPLGCPGRRG